MTWFAVLLRLWWRSFLVKIKQSLIQTTVLVLARHLQDGVSKSSSVALLICELTELFDAPISTSFVRSKLDELLACRVNDITCISWYLGFFSSKVCYMVGVGSYLCLIVT